VRLQGETIYFVRITGRDVWGAPNYERIPINGCVVTPSGRSVEAGETTFWSLEAMVIFAPTYVELEEHDQLEIRGEEWYVSAPTFDHISPFGTGRGGTEIHASREVPT